MRTGLRTTAELSVEPRSDQVRLKLRRRVLMQALMHANPFRTADFRKYEIRSSRLRKKMGELNFDAVNSCSAVVTLSTYDFGCARVGDKVCTDG